MPTTRIEYSADFQYPDLIPKDLGATLTCPVYRNGALVAPSSGTYILRKPGGESFLSGSVAIVSDIAQAAVSSGSLSNESLQMGYRMEWSLVISTVTYVFRNEVGIVRAAPTCPVSDRDLLARHSSLNDWLAGSGQTSWQVWIDEAWSQCQRWLIQKGNRPHLILQSSDIKDLVGVWSLVVIMKDLATNASESDRVYRLRTEYMEELKALQDSLRLTYTSADEPVPDEEKRPTTPVTILGEHGWRNRY